MLEMRRGSLNLSEGQFFFFHWLYIPGWDLTSSMRFVTVMIFTKRGSLPHATKPNLEDQGILFILGHHL